MHITTVGLILVLAFTGSAFAEQEPVHSMPHSSHTGSGHSSPETMSQYGPTEPGQSAFAAIQEIVALLQADPETDWSQVNIEQLRQHLIDMDNVTMRSQVASEATGTRFQYRVSGATPEVVASIQRMITAHVATMANETPWNETVKLLENGALLTVEAEDPRQREQLSGLGFIGLLTAGMHHQTHHLALARGTDPH